jgi:hypothetical protein
MPCRFRPLAKASADSTYSVSPPEDLDASVSSSSGLASYGNSSYSATTASYASSSQGEYDSAGSASGIDLNEYMQDRFAETFNPIPLDSCTVKQAQTWVAFSSIFPAAIHARCGHLASDCWWGASRETGSVFAIKTFEQFAD